MTRFQGIETIIFFKLISIGRVITEMTRFQGIETHSSSPTLHPHFIITEMTRFQGIETSSPPLVVSCKVITEMTRFQGIETEHLCCFVAHSSPYYRNDPIPGDWN